MMERTKCSLTYEDIAQRDHGEIDQIVYRYLGMEVLDASRRPDEPPTMGYAIAMARTPVSSGLLVREKATGYGRSGKRRGKRN